MYMYSKRLIIIHAHTVHIKQEMAVKIIHVEVIWHRVGAMFDKLQHHTWTAFKLTEKG